MTNIATRTDYEDNLGEWWSLETAIATGGYEFGGGQYGDNQYVFGSETEVQAYAQAVLARLPAHPRQLTSVVYSKPTIDELVEYGANEASDTVEAAAALEAWGI